MKNPFRLSTVLILCIILGVLDTIFTDIGLRSDIIEEANPMIKTIYEGSIIGYYTFKLLPYVILILLFKFINSSQLVRNTLTACAVVYVGIALAHARWIIVYSSLTYL